MSKKQKPAGQGGRSGQRGSFDDGASLACRPGEIQCISSKERDGGAA